MGFGDRWVGIGGWVLVVSFFVMGFDFGMGIDCGGVVILVVENWCLCLSFGGN